MPDDPNKKAAVSPAVNNPFFDPMAMPYGDPMAMPYGDPPVMPFGGFGGHPFFHPFFHHHFIHHHFHHHFFHHRDFGGPPFTGY